jgi:hypothetical protein
MLHHKCFAAITLSLESIRGLWIQDLDLFLYFRGATIGTKDLLLSALTPHEY